mgnify:CR=1 FL=1
MNNQTQTYLCIREAAGQAWYYSTARPLEEFVFLNSFGAYRDLQVAFSAMALVDPSIQRADPNNLR